MGESLWLAVCPRRSSMAPLIVSRRVDDDGLQAFAADVGACDPDIVEVRVYPLASERTVTFAGPGLHRLVEEHKERAELARLKAKYEPASAVVGVPGSVAVVSAETKPVVLVAPPDSANRSYIVPLGETPDEAASRINADPDSPFTAVVVDGVVRLHQVVWGVSGRVLTPEGPSPDGVAFLASMARQVRPSLSMASCRAAARELYHKLGGYSTARAAEAVADRAALLDAGIPSASIVGGPVAAPYCFSAPVPGYVTSAGEEKSRP